MDNFVDKPVDGLASGCTVTANEEVPALREKDRHRLDVRHIDGRYIRYHGTATSSRIAPTPDMMSRVLPDGMVGESPTARPAPAAVGVVMAVQMGKGYRPAEEHADLCAEPTPTPRRYTDRLRGFPAMGAVCLAHARLPDRRTT